MLKVEKNVDEPVIWDAIVLMWGYCHDRYYACCWRASLHLSYRQTIDTRRTKSQHVNVSCLVLQLTLPNPLKPVVKSRMKMQLEQRRSAMLQLHLRDQQFYCPLRCDLYWRFDGNSAVPLNPNEIKTMLFQYRSADWYIQITWWNPPMNATGPCWWEINIGCGNGLVPSCKSHFLSLCWRRSSLTLCHLATVLTLCVLTFMREVNQYMYSLLELRIWYKISIRCYGQDSKILWPRLQERYFFTQLNSARSNDRNYINNRKKPYLNNIDSWTYGNIILYSDNPKYRSSCQ